VALDNLPIGTSIGMVQLTLWRASRKRQGIQV